MRRGRRMPREGGGASAPVAAAVAAPASDIRFLEYESGSGTWPNGGDLKPPSIDLSGIPLSSADLLGFQVPHFAGGVQDWDEPGTQATRIWNVGRFDLFFVFKVPPRAGGGGGAQYYELDGTMLTDTDGWTGVGLQNDGTVSAGTNFAVAGDVTLTTPAAYDDDSVHVARLSWDTADMGFQVDDALELKATGPGAILSLGSGILVGTDWGRGNAFEGLFGMWGFLGGDVAEGIARRAAMYAYLASLGVTVP